MPDVLEPIREGRRAQERSAPRRVWVRRACCLLLAAVPVLALLNVVGQRAHDSTASSPAATLVLHAPSRLRPGLLYQTKFTIVAHQAIKDATLVLGNGWLDGLTMNTNEPSASSETTGPDGGVSLSLGSLNAGQTYVQYFDFQVNPTTIGRRTQSVILRSGSSQLLAFDHTLTVIP
jgi:hypothetical protein